MMGGHVIIDAAAVGNEGGPTEKAVVFARAAPPQGRFQPVLVRKSTGDGKQQETIGSDWHLGREGGIMQIIYNQ